MGIWTKLRLEIIIFILLDVFIILNIIIKKFIKILLSLFKKI